MLSIVGQDNRRDLMGVMGFSGYDETGTLLSLFNMMLEVCCFNISIQSPKPIKLLLFYHHQITRKDFLSDLSV